MRIAIDVHTHSITSGHAYSTLEEMVSAAKKRRLRGFALTDHGPGLQCGPHPWHFGNLRVLPEKIRGIRVYKGIEANIMDMDGRIDLDDRLLARLEFVLAGFHEAAFPSRSEEDNTDAMMKALEHPFVDAISHPGNPAYPVDFLAIAAAAKKNGKALEINDSSFRVRTGSDESCPRLARACMELGTKIVCGSDAHWSGDVGRMERVTAVLESIDFPRELIVNSSQASFEAFLEERRAAKPSL